MQKADLTGATCAEILIEKALEPPARSALDETVSKAATELERLKAEKQRLLSLTLKGCFQTGR